MINGWILLFAIISGLTVTGSMIVGIAKDLKR